jgi:BlaI family penicillinase repressor
MPRPKSKQPTERELKLLQALWTLGPARLSEIAAKINETESVALTTVATMMKLMEDKRLVKRVSKGSQTLWAALVSQDDTKTNFLQHLVETLFDGSSKRLVSHLLEQQKFSKEEQDEIAQMLKKEKSKGQGKD